MTGKNVLNNMNNDTQPIKLLVDKARTDLANPNWRETYVGHNGSITNLINLANSPSVKKTLLGIKTELVNKYNEYTNAKEKVLQGDPPVLAWVEYEGGIQIINQTPTGSGGLGIQENFIQIANNFGNVTAVLGNLTLDEITTAGNTTSNSITVDAINSGNISLGGTTLDVQGGILADNGTTIYQGGIFTGDLTGTATNATNAGSSGQLYYNNGFPMVDSGGVLYYYAPSYSEPFVPCLVENGNIYSFTGSIIIGYDGTIYTNTMVFVADYSGNVYDGQGNIIWATYAMQNGNYSGLTAGTISGNITETQVSGLTSDLSNLVPYSGATGNISLGSQSLSTTGNISATYFIGNGSLLTEITAGNLTTVTTAGNTTTNAITVGGLTMSGNISLGNHSLSTTGNGTNLIGNLTTTGNISAGYLIGNGSQLTRIGGKPLFYVNGNILTTSQSSLQSPSGHAIFDSSGDLLYPAGGYILSDTSGNLYYYGNAQQYLIDNINNIYYPNGDTLVDGMTNGLYASNGGGGVPGISVTITTAKLTLAGSQGSMTFTNGLLTAQTPANLNFFIRKSLYEYFNTDISNPSTKSCQ